MRAEIGTEKIPPEWAGFFVSGFARFAGFATVSLFGKATGVNDSVLFDREGLELADGDGSSEKLFGRRRMVQLREGKF